MDDEAAELLPAGRPSSELDLLPPVPDGFASNHWVGATLDGWSSVGFFSRVRVYSESELFENEHGLDPHPNGRRMCWDEDVCFATWLADEAEASDEGLIEDLWTWIGAVEKENRQPPILGTVQKPEGEDAGGLWGFDSGFMPESREVVT